MMWNVPQEGVKVELGSLISHIRVSAMPEDLPVGTWFIGLEDIASQEGQIVNLSHVSDVRSRVFQFQNGDVLYGRLRPYLKKAAVADFDGSASGEIIVLRCSEKILPRYLLVLLLSQDFTQFVNALTKGDRPRTSFATISSYQLDLPSLEVQADVCARDSRLVTAVSKLAEARVRLECAAALLMDTMRSRLIWSTSEEAGLVPLASLVEAIDYGTSQKCTYNSVGIPVLRIPNISSFGEIDAKDLKYAPMNRQEVERYHLKTGDILLIRSNGSLSLVGRAAKVGKDHEGYAFAGYLLRMSPRNGVLSDYLLELLRSAPFVQMVKTAARSSTGINNLSAGRLAAFRVPLLPIKRQEQIVDTLARLQSAVATSTGDLMQVWSSAKALQETARSGWVGHIVSQTSEKLINTTRERRVEPDYVDGEGLQMDKDVETTVLHRLDAMPSRASSFETLSNGLKFDYDALRDAVYKLLSAKPPGLEQVFDKRTRSIILRRPK